MAEKYSEQNSHKRNIETFKYILIAAFLILLIVGRYKRNYRKGRKGRYRWSVRLRKIHLSPLS